MAWYRCLYAPRTGGAYDSHHRTAGIAGCTRRRGSRVAACGARLVALAALHCRTQVEVRQSPADRYLASCNVARTSPGYSSGPDAAGIHISRGQKRGRAARRRPSKCHAMPCHVCASLASEGRQVEARLWLDAGAGHWSRRTLTARSGLCWRGMPPRSTINLVSRGPWPGQSP